MGVKMITVPQGTIVSTNSGNAKLTWNADFATKRNANFSQKQKFVDSEVLRRCSPRVPFRTGMLEKSGTLGTTIGSGEVNYTAPYAAKQYYDTADTRSYDANRGAHWFERMKVAEKEDILNGAKKV